MVTVFWSPASWVECEVFEAIGRKVGVVEEVAKETLDKSELVFGRVRVQTDDLSFIYKLLEMRIFYCCYKLVVGE